MINFFIGTLVQIYKFTKKDESRTVFRRRFIIDKTKCAGIQNQMRLFGG